jgi:hypothetical protein
MLPSDKGEKDTAESEDTETRYKRDSYLPQRRQARLLFKIAKNGGRLTENDQQNGDHKRQRQKEQNRLESGQKTPYSGKIQRLVSVNIVHFSPKITKFHPK